MVAGNALVGGNGGSGMFGGVGGIGGEGGSDQGGGIYVGNGTLSISGSTIAANSLHAGDGGHASGNSVASGMSGGGGTSQGGGLYVGGGALTINDSTVAANTLRGGSGGIGGFNGRGGNGGSGQAGGLWVVAAASVQVSFSTIAANQATGGMHGDGTNGDGTDGAATGGGIVIQGTLQTDDTIVAGNTVTGPGTNTSPDLFGNLGSLGHNLIGNTQGGSGFDPTDLLNVDPLFGPLWDYGGPTETMALLPGSPALNAGDPAQLGTADQRGVIRTGGVNIGAYQASAIAFVLDAPATVTAGVPFDVTVMAVDPFGQVAVGYLGTVTFSTSDPDPGVVLPADYTFTLDDGGSHTFTDTGLGETTLVTPGDQTLTVMDTADNTITGSTTVTVDSMVAGAGSHGLVQAPQPGRLPGSVPQASELPQRQVVDWWFASVNKRDVGLILAQPIHHTHAEADWWALDPWWGVERVA
jgi:hypothetical protein